MAKKPHFGPNLVPWLETWAADFFFFPSKIWLRQSLDIMVNYHHVQYQKKTNAKISDGRTDRETDRQTDKSDFIERCPNNVERPIKYKQHFKFFELFLLNQKCIIYSIQPFSKEDMKILNYSCRCSLVDIYINIHKLYN